jgi:hypothetical protein
MSTSGPTWPSKTCGRRRHARRTTTSCCSGTRQLRRLVHAERQFQPDLAASDAEQDCRNAALLRGKFVNLLQAACEGGHTEQLVPVARALKSMRRSNSGVTWIRQRHVTAFLKDLAMAPTITHEKLDELPGADRTRNYIRACWSSTAPFRSATNSQSATTNGRPVHSSLERRHRDRRRRHRQSGEDRVRTPSPLDEPMRQLAAAPGNDLTASHPNSNWVFRGYSPGRHIHGSSLRSRLKSVFSTRAARLGTLH